jgi:predicted metal-dependent enzyme (double-stranded beta helix superfamily)
MNALAEAPALTGAAQAKAEKDVLALCRRAVANGDELEAASVLKTGLVELAREGTLESLGFLAPRPDRYARRMIYADPWNRFTVIAMTWGVGQGTALHDHAGVWCVEVVVDGEMEAVSYQMLDEDAFGHCLFEERETIPAYPASSGALIPPFEHHIFRNTGRTAARTLHVYGGPMNHCDIFERVADGWWQRQHRELRYDG